MIIKVKTLVFCENFMSYGDVHVMVTENHVSKLLQVLAQYPTFLYWVAEYFQCLNRAIQNIRCKNSEILLSV